jgi:dTDP-glucose pyrophosphorylase
MNLCHRRLRDVIVIIEKPDTPRLNLVMTCFYAFFDYVSRLPSDVIYKPRQA